MIKYVQPEENFPAWYELDYEFNEFRRNLINLNRKYASTISRLLGEEDHLLYSEIFDFLKQNDLNTVAIPTIDELGKYKGGYSLVKKISQNNGLKAVRRKYVPWAMKKVAEDSRPIQGGETSPSGEQSAEENNMRELMDEINQLQSRLLLQQKEFEKAKIELSNMREKNEVEARFNKKRLDKNLQNTFIEKEMLTKEYELLQRQLSKNEEKHRLEMQMMAKQIEQLKKDS